MHYAKLALMFLGLAGIGAGYAQTTSASTPPPSDSVSLTQIMDEAGQLENQESTTLAQQQTAETQAIQEQAQAQKNAAIEMKGGATQMMKGAAAGLAVSAAATGYSISGVTQASQEGDEAEKTSEAEQQTHTRKRH